MSTHAPCALAQIKSLLDYLNECERDASGRALAKKLWSEVEGMSEVPFSSRRVILREGELTRHVEDSATKTSTRHFYLFEGARGRAGKGGRGDGKGEWRGQRLLCVLMPRCAGTYW